MCMKKFTIYTFSNKEAFGRIVEELNVDENVNKAQIKAILFIVTKHDRDLKLNKEPFSILCDYKNIDYKLKAIALHFRGWGEFWEMIKLVKTEKRHVFGSINLELR